MPMMPNQSNPFQMGPGSPMPQQGQTPPIMAPGQMPPQLPNAGQIMQNLPQPNPGGGYFNSIFNPNAGSPSAFTSPGANPDMMRQLFQMQGGMGQPPGQQPGQPGGDLMQMIQQFRDNHAGAGQYQGQRQGMNDQRQQMIQQMLARMGGQFGQQQNPGGMNWPMTGQA